MSAPTAGYSGTPLPTKLGIKPGHRVLVAGAPAGFDLGALPADVTVHRRSGQAAYDVLLVFCSDRATFLDRLLPMKERTVVNGSLWISWPKKASPLWRDLDENVVRDAALENGLVDVKVCAVDQDWSGLKLVRPLKDR